MLHIKLYKNITVKIKKLVDSYAHDCLSEKGQVNTFTSKHIHK